ncbi:FK506-binding protein 4 [Hibiscus syriacus]|uniref:peptidylprolyl isomerase n=1 Tax=Hibiscus syriacus TaxID=106335 RepID=A0A6A2YKU8_HIBSY|nr:peptidyl-prolyl cis-trans isomerase FKBP53-like [Hibiscus syriacus]KAE8678314.1 FK506-binding protein 4 [Hibiscus syriacus]
MGFWGIEVKPGKPHPYHSDNVRGKLHITQATLGLGSSKERAVLQCSVGHNSPIILCSLLPNRNETCSLDLKFDEDDELVAFSVIGSRSIHLSGYFVADDDGGHLGDEYESDSYGEDIAETESEDESSDYDSDDKYGGDFIDDDDLEFYPPSPVPNSGVVIEEIMDDEKPLSGNEESKQSKKKNKLTSSEEQKNSRCQLIVKRGAVVTDLETEDEDGFPVSASHKSEDAIQQPQPETEKQRGTLTTEEDKRKGKDLSEKKRKVKSIDEDSQQEGKKKKKKQKGKGTDTIINGLPDDDQPVKEESQDPEQVMPVGNKQVHPHSDRVLGSDLDNIPGDNFFEKKKKKKNRKKTTQDNQTDANASVSHSGDKGTSTLESEEKPTASKSSQVRTFPNGFVVQELAMGKPDGKRASRGKQVSVHYIGKLQKNGKIFDSNVGRAPFKFRLGVGEVIKGWDVGVEGMRIGDKRKLIIPPAMGYGSAGAGGRIPPNAWLEFDVELVGVR